MALKMKSSAFNDGERLPTKYTCEGENVSPPLTWAGNPDGTRSFAMVMDDPDAPGKTFTHWVIYNIPAFVNSLPEGLPVDAQLSDGMLQGRNDYGDTGYKGPCPPPGKPHRYRFHIYALDRTLNLRPGASKTELLSEIEGSPIESFSLTGLFER